MSSLTKLGLGRPGSVITLWAVTFGTVKRTVSRLIILIVSMRYGVVRPTLGRLTSKVAVLGGTFFVASGVVGIIENLYFKSNDVYNEQWQSAWIIPAFWQVLSFSPLCVICALWAPSQNSMRYGCSSGDAGEEFDKDDTLTLIKPSPLASKDVKSLEHWSAGSGNYSPHSTNDLEQEKTA